jgi:hypothetical protein
MRSTAIHFSLRRSLRTRRAAPAARVHVRQTPAPAARGRRRIAGQARSSARARVTRIAPRPPLDRVRPLRIIPRGIVPYVKH